MQQVAVSTASFCLWDIGPAGKLTICKELGCDRVEVAFSSVKMLKDFVSFPSPLIQLAEFKHITIHMPWCGVSYGNNATSRKIMDYVQLINEKLQVEAFVIHFDTISDFDWVEKRDFPVYLENALRNGSWPLFQHVLKNYPFDCVLDINRATRFGDYLDQIIEEHRDDIKEIHVSGFINDLGRIPIRESNQEPLLDRVKEINVPFVIEGLFSPGDLEAIRKEIRLIQDKTCCLEL
ncbi:hypothetical protein [Candidatus Formimonas warabiya]|uniref:Xylose isomerase-like TIM barrel domain-containing protein n=1 Tax=Formimonas warabiya TaxID=1761012 RepID=A0A3G1KY84_FORW1|nr:hypothetical protein [Candidatus Formimonas warabiya]ATW27438.1 hypothetical protein DCMF_24180 [Candidatus Formimonas warabiya]